MAAGVTHKHSVLGHGSENGLLPRGDGQCVDLALGHAEEEMLSHRRSVGVRKSHGSAGAARPGTACRPDMGAVRAPHHQEECMVDLSSLELSRTDDSRRGAEVCSRRARAKPISSRGPDRRATAPAHPQKATPRGFDLTCQKSYSQSVLRSRTPRLPSPPAACRALFGIRTLIPSTSQVPQSLTQ